MRPEEQKRFSEILEETVSTLSQFMESVIEAVAEVIVAFVDVIYTSYESVDAPFRHDMQGLSLWIDILSKTGRREQEIERDQIQRELMLDAARLGREILSAQRGG